ncbi:MAG TPA: hypothetical protein VIY73_25970 [Polyangiaceae bacterium]
MVRRLAGIVPFLAAGCLPVAVAPPAPRIALHAMPVAPGTNVSPSSTVAAAPATSPGGVTARPCPRDSAASKAASTAIDDLSARIAALPPDGDPHPLAAGLGHLLEGPCLALAQLEGRDWDFTSSLSLRSFWDGGGRAWAEGFLALGSAKPEERITWVPPTPRKALTLEATPHHALAPWLLCSERDDACGKETEPWVRRANTYFRLFDAVRRAEDSPPVSDPRGACADRALAPGVAEPYVEWRACVEATAQAHTALPLGRFRAPHEGWLFVRGRRGHYGFCDEVRAYDLATGAAYVAQSCSGLSLRHDGSVDGAQTDAARKDRTRAGRVDVSLLREAAWMMALTEESQQDVIDDAFGWVLPGGIEPVAESGQGGSMSMHWSSSSGQTQLEWQWVARGTTVTTGTLTWPEDYNEAARDHAVKLLDIAEASFQEGCAPAGPPARVPAKKKGGGVSAIDASADSLRGAQDDLSRALVGAHAKRCGK